MRAIGGDVHQYNRNITYSQTLAQMWQLRDGRARCSKGAAVPTSHPADAAICARLLEETAGMFALLAATVRLHIVCLLMAGDRDVGTLADETGQSMATVSHHLGKLRLAGVVRARRQGRRQLYVLSDVRVGEVARLALGNRLQPPPGAPRSTDAGCPERASADRTPNIWPRGRSASQVGRGGIGGVLNIWSRGRPTGKDHSETIADVRRG